jgi:hypothetical protein
MNNDHTMMLGILSRAPQASAHDASSPQPRSEATASEY